MRPSLPIVVAADAANFTTSPCVCSATVGMFLDTLGPLRSVFLIFETKASMPRPEILMSQAPSNLPNSSMAMNSASLSGVSAFSASNPGRPCCSHHVAARSVSDRKTLPLLQPVVLPLGSSSSSRDTVVPLPVPERPQRTTTPPSLTAAPMCAMIALQTSSGVLPRTSMTWYSGGGSSFGSTPLAMDASTPRCSFSASSSSRLTMESPSNLLSLAKPASPSSLEMMAADVVAFCFSRVAASRAIVGLRKQLRMKFI
mmetsp:Transcript_12674/g.37700  ORF Transcript_12674/g.37700 Transcript_12674/m.37700 type:complete len:256 (+) Transcript_12674:254-1021(+)